MAGQKNAPALKELKPKEESSAGVRPLYMWLVDDRISCGKKVSESLHSVNSSGRQHSQTTPWVVSWLWNADTKIHAVMKTKV